MTLGETQERGDYLSLLVESPSSVADDRIMCFIVWLSWSLCNEDDDDEEDDDAVGNCVSSIIASRQATTI